MQWLEIARRSIVVSWSFSVWWNAHGRNTEQEYGKGLLA